MFFLWHVMGDHLYWKIEFHKIILIMSEKSFLQKQIFFFVVQVVNTNVSWSSSLFHSARKKFVSEKIEVICRKNMKNDEIFQISQVRPKKKILKKKWTFFETEQNQQEYVPRCYKAILVCFYSFLNTLLVRFYRFELNP